MNKVTHVLAYMSKLPTLTDFCQLCHGYLNCGLHGTQWLSLFPVQNFSSGPSQILLKYPMIRRSILKHTTTVYYDVPLNNIMLFRIINIQYYASTIAQNPTQYTIPRFLLHDWQLYHTFGQISPVDRFWNANMACAVLKVKIWSPGTLM